MCICSVSWHVYTYRLEHQAMTKRRFQSNLQVTCHKLRSSVWLHSREQRELHLTFTTDSRGADRLRQTIPATELARRQKICTHDENRIQRTLLKSCK